MCFSQLSSPSSYFHDQGECVPCTAVKWQPWTRREKEFGNSGESSRGDTEKRNPERGQMWESLATLNEDMVSTQKWESVATLAKGI